MSSNLAYDNIDINKLFPKKQAQNTRPYTEKLSKRRKKSNDIKSKQTKPDYKPEYNIKEQYIPKINPNINKLLNKRTDSIPSIKKTKPKPLPMSILDKNFQDFIEDNRNKTHGQSEIYDYLKKDSETFHEKLSELMYGRRGRSSESNARKTKSLTTQNFYSNNPSIPKKDPMSKYDVVKVELNRNPNPEIDQDSILYDENNITSSPHKSGSNSKPNSNCPSNEKNIGEICEDPYSSHFYTNLQNMHNKKPKPVDNNFLDFTSVEELRENFNKVNPAHRLLEDESIQWRYDNLNSSSPKIPLNQLVGKNNHKVPAIDPSHDDYLQFEKLNKYIYTSQPIIEDKNEDKENSFYNVTDKPSKQISRPVSSKEFKRLTLTDKVALERQFRNTTKDFEKIDRSNYIHPVPKPLKLSEEQALKHKMNRRKTFNQNMNKKLDDIYKIIGRADDKLVEDEIEDLGQYDNDHEQDMLRESDQYENRIENVIEDIYNDLEYVNMDFQRNNKNYLPMKYK